MLISLFEIEDWSFGRILMAILLLNFVLFIILTCVPGLHNSVTQGAKRLVDFIVPKSAKKTEN